MSMLEKEIARHAQSFAAYLAQTRGYLHEYPEVSNEEFRTAEFLKKQISETGLKILEVDGTGFIAVLETGRKGKTIALRTDIDALPVPEHEYNLKHKKKYLSKHEGKSHACGHDGHMAILLTAAKILQKIKQHLTGTVLFLFEEAEENQSGWQAMLKGMEQFSIDAVYGNHLLCYIDEGKFDVSAGAQMAGIKKIGLTVIGRGGHGSRPDLAINPLFALVQILSNVSTAWSNQLDITSPVTLGITRIDVGSAWNVIADRAVCEGSIRYYDTIAGEKAGDVFKHVATHVAAAHNCTVTFDKKMADTGVPLINDAALAERAKAAVIKQFGEQAIAPRYRWFASESFTEYARRYPAMFSFVGIKNPEDGIGADHHNEKFDFNDGVLVGAVVLMTQFAVDFLTDTVD